MKIPFSPSVYEHAARFTGRSPWDVSRDPELLFAGHRAAWMEYRHSPVVVCNVETDQAAFVERVGRTHPHVKVRVNMDAGMVASPEPPRIYREIDRILGIAAGRANCLMGTGCLPLETPPENIRLIREYLA